MWLGKVRTLPNHGFLARSYSRIIATIVALHVCNWWVIQPIICPINAATIPWISAHGACNRLLNRHELMCDWLYIKPARAVVNNYSASSQSESRRAIIARAPSCAKHYPAPPAPLRHGPRPWVQPMATQPKAQAYSACARRARAPGAPLGHSRLG